MAGSGLRGQMSGFWRTTPFADMTRAQWESLCDGCAKCCLVKLQDEDTDPDAPDATEYTNIACRLLDLGTCRCSDYENRARRVPDCVVLTPRNLPRVANWLPGTCAYRLLHEGRELPWWHPLVSGEEGSVSRAGVSLAGRMIPEEAVGPDDYEDHIIPRSLVDAMPPADEDE